MLIFSTCIVATLAHHVMLIVHTRKIFSNTDAIENTNPLNSAFDVMNILLGGPLAAISSRHSTRLVLIGLLFSSMVLRCAYLGSMFHFLQAQIYSEPVNTVEQIYRHNYTVFATPTLLDLIYAYNPSMRPL